MPVQPDKGFGPTAEEILQAAAACGLVERRAERSRTLFFHSEPLGCDYNVFYTTRSVMTRLTHPARGDNQLFRSSTYESLEDLVALFRNPRAHTGKGYRMAQDAMRCCVGCGELWKRSSFSLNQWKQGPEKNQCKQCIKARQDGADPLTHNKAIDQLVLELPPKVQIKEEPEEEKDVARPPLGALTEQNLIKHDKTMEVICRRQFRCPSHGVFFKKVPDRKPVTTCPSCRSEGKPKKWLAIPRKQEKGFGLFRCGMCQSTWGSSMACRSLGQFCGQDHCPGRETPVFPFKILAQRRGGSGGRGRPIRKQSRPDALETIPEPAEQTFDHKFTRGGIGKQGYFQILEDQPHEISFPEEDIKAEAWGDDGTRKLRHRCTGCDRGLCRDLKVPLSKAHKSTGSTAKTCSARTWSTCSDLANFADRDAY